MRRPCPVLVAAAVALGACAGRAGEAQLRDAPAREQVRTVAGVRWQELYARGVELAEAGDLTRGEQYIAASLSRGGPPERVLPRLLRVCVAAQRYRAAVEYARPYLERHAGAWALRFVVAAIRIGLGDAAAARQDLELVLAHNPRHAEAHFALGQLLRDDLGDPAGADDHFRRYLDLEPAGAHAEEARAGLLRRVGP